MSEKETIRREILNCFGVPEALGKELEKEFEEEWRMYAETFGHTEEEN